MDCHCLSHGIDLFGIESSIINHPYTIFQIIRLSFMCVVLVFVSFCFVSFTRYSSRLDDCIVS